MNDPMAELVDRLAAMDARVRLLEGGQRAGLSSTQLSGYQPATTLTAYGSNNWSTLGGLSPTLTMTTGRRVVILGSFRPRKFGNPGGTVGVNDWKTLDVTMGIQIDATEPQSFSSPTMRSQVAHSAAVGGEILHPATLVTFREDLVPGEHVFTMKFYATLSYPLNTVDPQVDDMSLTVIPL